MSDGPILDLSTLAPERQTVRIKSSKHPEGKLYELATPNDLSLEDQQFLYARAGVLDSLMGKRKLSRNQRDELRMVLDKGAAIVLLDAPTEILDELSDLHKQSVILVFLTAFADSLEQTVKAATGQSSPSTSES